MFNRAIPRLTPALEAFTDSNASAGGKKARVVNLSSVMHRHGTPDWGKVDGRQEGETSGAYKASKLAMLLFSRELSRRTNGKVIGVAPNPGKSQSLAQLAGCWQGVD
jgi:NAD(P)-dependent dehydrogenase (short-subunit alcohol dehydrogenase family)